LRRLQRCRIKLRRLKQGTVFRRRVDVRAYARDGAVGGFDPRHAKVCNLDGLAIRRQQEILWLDVAMDDAAFVCMGQPCANLFEIKKRALKRQRFGSNQLCHVAAAEILEHEIVKRGAIQIEGGAMSQTTDDV